LGAHTQHTWKETKEIIVGLYNCNDLLIVKKIQKWTYEIVWSLNKDHLHTLSCTCNDENVEGPYLSSMPTTIIHCCQLRNEAGRPLILEKLKAELQDKKFKAYDVIKLQIVTIKWNGLNA